MKIELSQSFEVLADSGTTGPSRTIQGVAVPYNTDANASTGPVRFLPGSLPTDGPAPKLLMHHDSTLPVGLVTERVDTPDAMLFSARISDTVAGNEALTLALDGVIDGVSVGIIATDFTFDDGVLVVSAADWRELSMTPFPAFSAAAITDVAAELADDPVDVPTDDDEPSSDTSEEDQMADVEAQAPIQSAPIILGGALTKPRVTASEYVVAMLTGNKSVLAADNELAQIPGLLPEPLIGDVWSSYYSGRPLCDALGTRALPQAGETFWRRYIQQTTAVANQVAEFDSLASAQFIVSRIQVDKKTFGGYLNVSAQSGDWSDPALVQQIINDMVRQYSIATEAYVGSRIANAADTATTTIVSPTDGDEVIAALYDGAAEMRVATGVLPTHLIVSTDIWAAFGQAKDAGGNRIFPYLGPVNAAGTSVGVANFGISPLGLNLVVSDDVAPANSATLVYAPAIEVYEDRSRTGGIRVENPATASATIGLWGYMGVCALNPLAGSSVGYVLSLF
jgi:HK97 family phage prohead protease